MYNKMSTPHPPVKDSAPFASTLVVYQCTSSSSRNSSREERRADYENGQEYCHCIRTAQKSVGNELSLSIYATQYMQYHHPTLEISLLAVMCTLVYTASDDKHKTFPS